MADNGVYFRSARVVSKAACIGHHATIDGYGSLSVHHVKTAQLPNNSKNDFARAAHISMRDGECCIHGRIQMMIHHHLLCRRCIQCRLHIVYPCRSIEVKTKNKVGLGKDFVCLFLVFVITHHAFYTRQPF